MEQPNPTFAKILILDTGKLEQWKFKIQQYLHNEHYALWEVIEFGDSYEAPQDDSSTGSSSESSVKKKGRTVAVTTEDMQKRRNDTFGGNEATKKTKKNQLKQQYGNFKAESSKTLEQTFNRLQAIASHLEFMDVEIEQDDLNQKFLTNDLYNHLKVYKPEVQKKSDSNSQNMAFISSAKNSSGKGKVNTASIPTASTQVSPASANVATASFSHDTILEKDWEKDYHTSYMENEEENHALVADEEAPTEFALMAKSSSSSKNEVFDNSLCSKSCKKNTDSLNTKITELSEKLSDCKTNLYHYKLGLSQVEARLVEFKNQEIKFFEKIRGLEFKVESKDNRIERLTNELEELKKEKEDDTITDYSRPSPSIESNSNNLQSSHSSVSENGESSSSILYKPMIKFVKAADNPTVIKTNKDESIRKSSVKYVEMYRKTSKSSNVRGNQRNWNNLKFQQLGENFLMKNKACFKCGHFDHLAYDCGVWVEQGKTWAKNNYTHKSRTPRTVFHKTDKTPAAVNRTHMNVAQPKRTYFSKSTHSYVKRPVQRKPAEKLLRPQFVGFGDLNRTLLTKGNSQNVINDKGYWDSGCSWHMTCNISYLSDYEPYDGGYVSFGKGGGKITGKGSIKTGKLEFENVYFVKDLKYNLFSVSQICDNKNSVLFTDSECIVLGKDFKLKDDTNVLLKTPRKHNMYSIDLNNIVPHKGLTCLVAKASADECMLWHRRIGHLNIKTMNKLVRHNLVKGLPSKCFENDHTCVACLKGKHHKASCKIKLVHSVTKPFYTLHIDLFGPTSNETSGILRNFITEIENLKDLKVKIIRTLIEAARTMLADAKLPVTFWAKAVNTACYVQNRVLVNKSQNKTLYELFNVVVAGTSSTNFSGTKDAASQDVKKDVSSLRYIALPNWFHEAYLESSTSNAHDACNADAPESSENSNPTATLTNPLADQMETLIVKTLIPTVSSPVPTACLDDSLQPSSDTRLISKRVTSQDDTPYLDNILTLSNRFEDILGVTTNTGDTNGVEADLGNMENNISASPIPTFRIHKDHLKIVRIEAIGLFLAYASFMGFTVYQMDVKSAFLYGTIDEEVYVMQPPKFQDPEFPARVYKVEKAIEFEALMHEKFQMSAMGELNFFLGLQVLQKKDGIFLSQDKYVGDILKKFGYSDARSSNTPMDKENPWGKDRTGKDVDLHLYRSMIGSLMYLTASRPDIMFAVCAYARH
uniref:Putative ribonuclease H-like domain-containing protein n=1 Tax=Tanacetum cinerariifolium TaxID=118510 RepID=A0A6L2J2S0_TANCI|nr:putative ribonuclease H-like domain-containing protein [Tanacetum cinerariifolium]